MQLQIRVHPYEVYDGVARDHDEKAFVVSARFYFRQKYRKTHFGLRRIVVCDVKGYREAN